MCITPEKWIKDRATGGYGSVFKLTKDGIFTVTFDIVPRSKTFQENAT